MSTSKLQTSKLETTNRKVLVCALSGGGFWWVMSSDDQSKLLSHVLKFFDKREYWWIFDNPSSSQLETRYRFFEELSDVKGMFGDPCLRCPLLQV